jgi:putative acetyltransferase
MTAQHQLRPFLPADAPGLRELIAASIEELTADDYDEDQRIAWAGTAEDEAAFARRLSQALTLLVVEDGEPVGFASLKDNRVLDMLYVHPFHIRDGVGTALVDALEKLATARGAREITVESSDTAQPFFEARGYVPTQRNSKPIGDVWLATTTMKKTLQTLAAKTEP